MKLFSAHWIVELSSICVDVISKWQKLWIKRYHFSSIDWATPPDIFFEAGQKKKKVLHLEKYVSRFFMTNVSVIPFYRQDQVKNSLLRHSRILLMIFSKSTVND